MKAIMGKQQYKNAEGQGVDLIISTAVCALGLILFVMIFFVNNKERVPFTQEKVSIKDSIKVVFGNKNLLIGSTPHSVNIVDQLSDDEIICDADSVNCTEQKLPDFAEALKINIAKKFGKNTAASARKEDENDKKSNS